MSIGLSLHRSPDHRYNMMTQLSQTRVHPAIYRIRIYIIMDIKMYIRMYIRMVDFRTAAVRTGIILTSTEITTIMGQTAGTKGTISREIND